MDNLLLFFSVLFVGLVSPAVLRRVHMPWVVALIVGGLLIGPHWLKIFSSNDTIDFIGELGLVFLMFLAGLEVRVRDFRKVQQGAGRIALLNGGIPFVAGVGVAFAFGYEFSTMLLLGTVFISSSIAVVLPSLESKGLLRLPLGKSIMLATIIEDALSLVLLSVLLQYRVPVTNVPLPVFYLLLVGALVVLRWSIPHIERLVGASTRTGGDRLQSELRTVLALLVGTVVLFQLVGLHSIVAGFFAGFVLSETITHRRLHEQIRTLSYGLFIPVFFILVGTRTDLSLLFEAGGNLLLVGTILVASVGSKLLGGWLGARSAGFNSRAGALVGVSTIPQLSTTLAVAFIGFELGLLDRPLLTSLVVLSIVTTIIGPTLTAAVVGRRRSFAQIKQE